MREEGPWRLPSFSLLSAADLHLATPVSRLPAGAQGLVVAVPLRRTTFQVSVSLKIPMIILFTETLLQGKRISAAHRRVSPPLVRRPPRLLLPRHLAGAQGPVDIVLPRHQQPQVSVSTESSAITLNFMGFSPQERGRILPALRPGPPPLLAPAAPDKINSSISITSSACPKSSWMHPPTPWSFSYTNESPAWRFLSPLPTSVTEWWRP